MNITSPIQTGAANAAELPGDSLTSLLRTFGFSDSPDGGLGIIMSALAGIAAALAVAIVLSVYFRGGYRSRQDLLKHGLAASAVLVLLAFAISDMRQAALAYLGLNPAKPAVEFEIRLPKAALATAADTQVELLTDRNQKLAKVQEALASTPYYAITVTVHLTLLDADARLWSAFGRLENALRFPFQHVEEFAIAERPADGLGAA